MAMRLSTRKRPDREVKMLKEHQTKFSERTFDDITIRTMKFLMNNKVFRSLDYPIQHGKEAAVYRGTSGDGEYVAVKIFKYEGPSFQKRVQYLEGDKRFDVPGNRRQLVKTFARKEYANLKLCTEAGVLCPKPIKQRDNIVVMEFLGEDGVPSELLKDAEITDVDRTIELIMDSMRKMHKAGIVHVDLSEFNIIYHKDLPYIIDVGQAVLSHHPDAVKYLANDLWNTLKFFSRRGVYLDHRKALGYIMGELDSYI